MLQSFTLFFKSKSFDLRSAIYFIVPSVSFISLAINFWQDSAFDFSLGLMLPRWLLLYHTTLMVSIIAL